MAFYLDLCNNDEEDEEEENLLIIPVPVPAPLACKNCPLHGSRRGWSSHDRHNQAIKHFKEKHCNGIITFKTLFRCRCGLDLTSLHEANHHLRRDCNGQSETEDDEDSPSDEVTITIQQITPNGNEELNEFGNAYTHNFIMDWPVGKRMLCCYCNFKSEAPKDTIQADSIRHHLFREHDIVGRRRWRCRHCGELNMPYHLSKHKCPSGQISSNEPDQSSSLQSHSENLINNSSNGEMEVAENGGDDNSEPETEDISEEEAESQSEYSTPPHSPTTHDVNTTFSEENDNLDTSSQSELSTESSSEAEQPESVTSTSLSSSSAEQSHETSTTDDSDINSSPNDPIAHSQSQEFFLQWSAQFSQVTSLIELDSVLANCAKAWAVSTRNPSEENARTARPRQQARGIPRRRLQSRQVQRSKASKKGERLAKAHIQRLFSLYPRKAIRKVLGEESKGYSGDRESAEAFLKRTYDRPNLTPEQTAAARKLYDECHWKELSEETFKQLSSPPKKEEIAAKLSRATNTAPGKDGLEYRHLRALDPNGKLLEIIFELVWKFGIPKAWKTSRTVPIYKKGDPSDYGNFRPISLLPTMYKLFSGIINSRLVDVASSMGWISPEQKGFLPGVRGIQEHTFLLQTARDIAVRLRKNLIITWLDLLNAFGSIPHAILEELFGSLPIPPVLRGLLSDIYRDNTLEFAVGSDTIPIDPTAGVRQGDPLSTEVFNLAIEPVLRAAKSAINQGFSLFGFLAKVTGYADDLAVLGTSVAEQQRVLDAVDAVASILQLQFNPEKCVSLVLEKGVVPENLEPALRIHDVPIRTLKHEENEEYLGTPMGSKLLFRMPDTLKEKLDRLADSGLSPWQKLEVFRCALLPSLSHHLASGKVEKGSLHGLEQDCKDFLRYVANVPMSTNSAFFYADRRVGGLGAQSLSQEADIWTIARAVQLLDSKDKTIKDIASAQLHQTILDGFGGRRQPEVIPYGEYLSGSMEKGLIAIAHGGARSNLWTRARAAANHLKGVKIDISGENPTKIIADDVSCISIKVVRGLRTAIRERWTSHLLKASQGKIATGLALDVKTKDIAFLTSCRTTLSFGDWHYLHRARLGLLPVRSCPGSRIPDKTCRRGCREAETTAHVISHCKNNLSLYTDRHNEVLNALAETLRRSGHHVTVNNAFDSTRLRPDLVIDSTSPETIIDVTVPLDTADNLNSAYQKKIEKYKDLGEILPLVVGSMGAWLPSNDVIRDALNIPPRIWNGFRRRSRLLAIQGTTRIIQRHLNSPSDSTEDEVDDRSQ